MRNNKNFVWSFIITFFLTRVLYAITGFKYNVFNEGINYKLIVDFGVWAGVFALVYWILMYRDGGKRNKKGDS